MKKFKKLIPALCMLLVSAVMLGTTTFAWFSMNTSVKATNMTVTAKSNSTYLQISKTSATEGFDISADMTKNDKVYPCAFDTDTNTFYTANNKQSDGKGEVINKKNIEMTDANYLSISTVYLKLTKDSEPYTDKPLTVTFALNEAGHASVKAVVKVGEEYKTLASGSGNNTATFSTTTITSETALTVTIYVYIDGTNSDVNSDYINNTATANSLTGIVELTFGINVN